MDFDEIFRRSIAIADSHLAMKDRNYISTAEQAVAHAKLIGTYGKIDRSRQYENQTDPRALLKSDNHQWARTRELEQAVSKLKIWALTGCVAALVSLCGWLADHLWTCVK